MFAMIGPALLLAAMVSPGSPPSSSAGLRSAEFRPAGGATARATASVRIVSGVSFGAGRSSEAPGASKRKVQLIDQEGQIRSAELLEFQ